MATILGNRSGRKSDAARATDTRLRLFKNGYTPLPANGKAVLIEGWSTMQVDAETIRKWEGSQSKATNTGVRTGHGLVAVDIDILDDAVADELQELLERELVDGQDLPPVRFGLRPKRLATFRIKGPDFPTFKSRPHIDSEGRPARIEILALGSQFIADGIHPDTGKPYEWVDGVGPDNVKFADLPTITEARLRAFIQDAECRFAELDWQIAKSAKREGEPLDLELAFEQIRTRASYHEPAVAIAAHYASKGIESKEATRRLKAVFHDVPKSERDDRWHREYQDIDRSVRTAYRKFEANAAPEPPSRKILMELLGPPLEIKDPIRAMNKRHAIVCVGGKTVVMTEGPDGISFGTEGDLRLRYKNRPWTNKRKVEIAEIAGGPHPAKMTIADAWLASPKRRDYPNGVVFRPDSETPTGTYNLWQGWKAEPDSTASCDRFLKHLLEVICNGDAAQYDWLVGWLAHMVQRPGEKPRSAIVLRGEKGAGKDMVGEYVSKLMQASAYFNTSDQNTVWGQFNGAIANKLLLHLEEAFFSGDHGADSRIKNLITAPTQTINEKHAPVYTVDSFHRLFITSNELRVVNSTAGERRYFISEVSGHRNNDKAYFEALVAEMNGSGPAALMHHLRTYDLSDWNPRPPATDALIESIGDNQTGVTAWMHDCIEERRIVGDSAGFDWPEDWELTERFRAAFDEWAKKPSNRFRGVMNVTSQAFGKQIRPFLVYDRQRKGPRDGREYHYLMQSWQDARETMDSILTKGNER